MPGLFMNKFNLLITDYIQAVGQLEKALAQTSENEVIQAGCIQYFEFCFELAWKTIKEAVLEQGFMDCLSPKACLKQAFVLGWIDNENVWLEMLKARNLMSHTYNSKESLKIYAALPEFLVEFKQLLLKIKN
jgi:nucleotidyltransferase substrate binding protein (TIGR01987 family)